MQIKSPTLQLSFAPQEQITLMPHQVEAVEFLETRTGAILADDPGLGKTISALKASAGKKVYVICPPSVMSVWEQESIKLNVPTPAIMSYGKLPVPHVIEKIVGWNAKKKRRMVQPMRDLPKDAVLIVDEAHACKNFKAKRTEAVSAISSGILANEGKVWLLTGTPMLNQPLELWGLLSLANIHWKAFGSWDRFISLFGGKKKYWGGYDFIPEAMQESEIKSALKEHLLRRTRELVLPNLPSKTHQIHNVTVPRQLYSYNPEEAKEAVMPEDIQGIAEISSFRKLLAMEKLKAIMDLIESFEDAGEPLVVFSKHLEPINFLLARKGWTGITGETTNQKREMAVSDFQNGRFLGFAGTIASAGVGITLTRASHCLFIDKEWTPALNRQAEARLHRIGQKNAVVIHHCNSDHMLDFHVDRVLGFKAEMIDATF